MITQRFYMPSCEWYVVVLYDVSPQDVSDIYDTLVEAGCSGTVLRSAVKNVKAGVKNSGFTYSNIDECISVVVIGETTSAEQFANTYDHEKGHLVRHISQTIGIEPHSEEEQYIAGEVGQTMFKVAKRFMCDECRRQKKIFFRSFGIK